MKKFFARAVMTAWGLSALVPVLGWGLVPVLDGIVPDAIMRQILAVSVAVFLLLTVAIFGAGIIGEDDL